MCRAILLSLLVLPMLLLVFGAGALTAIRLDWGMPIARVNVSSEAEIESIVVTYTTCGLTRKLAYRFSDQHARDTMPKEISMPFVLCGEGGHSTEVVLRDGKTFTTKGSYVAGGYEVTEHVTGSGIRSKYTRTLP